MKYQGEKRVDLLDGRKKIPSRNRNNLENNLGVLAVEGVLIKCEVWFLFPWWGDNSVRFGGRTARRGTARLGVRITVGAAEYTIWPCNKCLRHYFTAVGFVLEFSGRIYSGVSFYRRETPAQVLQCLVIGFVTSHSAHIRRFSKISWCTEACTAQITKSLEILRSFHKHHQKNLNQIFIIEKLHFALDFSSCIYTFIHAYKVKKKYWRLY